MRKQRTHYDKAFKENAVKLSIERKNVSELAQELSIKPLLLYRWRKELQEKGSLSFPGNGVQSQSAEAKELEVSRFTVAKHMKQMGLRSKLSKHFKVTTDSSHD